MTPSAAQRTSGALIAVALVVSVVGSLGAPLITSVATDLDVPLSAAQWTLTATLLVGAISAPVLGRIGTGPHRRAVILLGLAAVTLGGLLGAIPSPFPVVLLGRALQGIGLAIVPLLMSVARDHLAERAASTIATVSVASTVGIGVGYPLVGLIDELMGLRAAYAIGALLPFLAMIVAWRVLPRDPDRPRATVDVPGAVLLAAAMVCLLLPVSDPALWSPPWIALGLLAASGALFAVWIRIELRSPHPLVDLRVLSRRALVSANSVMLAAGVAMYLLFSAITRYVQTPPDAGYGFGLGGFAAGAVLVPFSVLGFLAGRVTSPLVRRIGARAALAVSAGTVATAAILFAAVPDRLAVVLLAMAALGYGVGGVSAVMPTLLLGGVSDVETASVLAMNQIVRATGFTVGSALSGLVLARFTPTGALVPQPGGYVAAALVTVPMIAVPVVLAVLTERIRAADGTD